MDKGEITFQDYKNCLFSKKDQMKSMNAIRSHKHEVCTEESNKIALSANDEANSLRGRCAYLSLWTLLLRE